MKDFFRIVGRTTSEDGTYFFEVELCAEHRIYEGHFPGMPIVPGVCTLSVIKRCASEIAGHELRYDTVRECKFLATVIPSNDTRLIIKINLGDLEDEVYKIGCEVRSGDRIMMKLKASLTENK